jgi:hypothetical protein
MRFISQNVAQIASGSVLSTHNGVKAVADEFSYPLNINFNLLTPDGSNCAYGKFCLCRLPLIFLL